MPGTLSSTRLLGEVLAKTLTYTTFSTICLAERTVKCIHGRLLAVRFVIFVRFIAYADLLSSKAKPTHHWSVTYDTHVDMFALT